MNMLYANCNLYWSHVMVEQLIASGCTYFAIAPGSRSTPLVAAVAAIPQAHPIGGYDERSLGFLALGIGKSTKKPAVVIVTSGTAVANLMPAVVEAYMSHVPMVILSADRPVELRDIGANQTIDQHNFFASYTRLFTEIPCPTLDISPEWVAKTVAYAVHKSMFEQSGPVHLNCLFREPLAPTEDPALRHAHLPRIAFKHPYAATHLHCPKEEMEIVLKHMHEAKNGVLVLGDLPSRADQQAVAEFARRLGWPVIADIQSGLRLSDIPTLLPYADDMLERSSYPSFFVPDVVFQIGGRLISKAVQKWLKAMHPIHIYLDAFLERNDPELTVTHRIQSHPRDLLPSWNWMGKKENGFLNHSIEMDAALDSFLSSQIGITEPYVARFLTRWLPDEDILFVSNSMPIRDINHYAVHGRKKAPIIYANRGASGIDGIISTAIGCAIGHQQRTTLLIGDLAFLHDSNGLSLLHQCPVPVRIVVVNNGGGGIFSFLPIAEFKKVLNPWIEAPHGHRLAGLCDAFGIQHYLVNDRDNFEEIFAKTQLLDTHCVMEVKSDRVENHCLHQELKVAMVSV